MPWIITKKYNKAPQNFNDQNFDSSKEAGHARMLQRMLDKKEILNYGKERIAFHILDGKLVASPNIKEIKAAIINIFLQNYYVDFRVEMKDGTIEYHEVKGNKKNPDWNRKEKLMDQCFGRDDNYKLLLII